VLIVSLPVGIISAKFSKTLEREQKTKIFLQIENKLSKVKKKIAHFNKDSYTEIHNK
jgi:hypothetical protein